MVLGGVHLRSLAMVATFCFMTLYVHKTNARNTFYTSSIIWNQRKQVCTNNQSTFPFKISFRKNFCSVPLSSLKEYLTSSIFHAPDSLTSTKKIWIFIAVFTAFPAAIAGLHDVCCFGFHHLNDFDRLA